MRLFIAVLVIPYLVAGTPWMSWAEEGSAPSAAAQPAEESAEAEDKEARFKQDINNLGISAGYAYKCSKPDGPERKAIGAQTNWIGDELVKDFGTSLAFGFIAYSGAASTGEGMDKDKCADYIADWKAYTKTEPEVDALWTQEKK